MNSTLAALKILAFHSGNRSPGPASAGMGARAMILSMRSGLAIFVVLLAMAGPAAGQEMRPTLDKIKETGAIQLGGARDEVYRLPDRTGPRSAAARPEKPGSRRFR